MRSTPKNRFFTLAFKNSAQSILEHVRRVSQFRSGQIKKNHEIGRWIEFLASLSTVNNIVEIGTWNGRGSSQAIIRGVNSRSKASRAAVKVIGYEINPKMIQKARKALKRHSFFDVVFGSIVRVGELDRIELDATEMSWLEQDEIWISNAPNVLSTVPLEIDLLILDGGEFSTFAEFKLLNARVRGWIILDDTRTRKREGIVRLAQQDKCFQIIYQSDERHGTAILKRVDLENG
jgi:hypothetical protein